MPLLLFLKVAFFFFRSTVFHSILLILEQEELEEETPLAFAPLCDEDVMLVSFLNQCRYTAVLSVLSIIAIGFQNFTVFTALYDANFQICDTFVHW